MKIIFAVFAILTLGISAWFGQTTTPRSMYTLHGTIKDPKGSVIAGLQLRTEARAALQSGVTNINGDFKIDLPPGDHVLVINSPEPYDFRAFIKITENGLNPDNVEFVVDPSRICCADTNGQIFPKPISLPRPAYPAAARAVRAGGEVVVQLRVDQEGKILSAKATSGHPLLKAAAEAAARGSRFEPSEQHDREVKLVYVFIPDGEPKRSGVVRYSDAYRIEIIAPPGAFVVSG